MESDQTGLYQKWRPQSFKRVVGQDSVIKQIQGMLGKPTFPRALMFTGPSGTGKTTLARITADELGCDPDDLFEINCSDERGIDTVRTIATMMRLRPRKGSNYRIWILDECQALTPDAMGALLKHLEEAPSHVIFMLATTDPHKVREAIKTRCKIFDLRPVPASAIKGLLIRVCKGEEASHVSDDVCELIADTCDGCPRRALNTLEGVLALQDEDAQRESVRSSSTDHSSKSLAQLLLKQGVTWSEIATVLRGVAENETEGVRRGVLNYAQSVVNSERPDVRKIPAATDILLTFRFDTYANGKAGLTAMCLEFMNR